MPKVNHVTNPPENLYLIRTDENSFRDGGILQHQQQQHRREKQRQYFVFLLQLLWHMLLRRSWRVYHRWRRSRGRKTNTVFSWQHFPPSTSSRSRCDDSSMQPEGSSLPESCKAEIVEEEAEASTSRVSSTEYPITKSKAQLDAEHYLNIRNIFQLFNFLIGHLICAEPEDPIQYLQEILDRCLLWRDCYGEEPLLVSKYHIKSLYATFDPYGKGSITKDQYEEAMDNIGLTKGISPYNACPPLNEEGKVDEEFFLNEAHRCFLENLRMMLRVPKDWEENRLLWNKKMLCKRRQERPMCERQSDYPGEDETDVAPSEPNAEVSKTTLPTACQQLLNMRHEPVQLFLPV